MSRAQVLLAKLDEAKNRRQAWHDKNPEGGKGLPLQPGLVNKRDFSRVEPGNTDPEWERQFKFHPATRIPTPRHYLTNAKGQEIPFPEHPYYDSDTVMRGSEHGAGGFHNEPYDVRTGKKEYKFGRTKRKSDYDKGGITSMSGADVRHPKSPTGHGERLEREKNLAFHQEFAQRRAADVARVKAQIEQMKKERG